MRLKSMNKTNSITLSRKNNSSSSAAATAAANTSIQDQQQQQHEINYEINSGESAFDLNMDSGDVITKF